jgi:hypothetical protein
MGGMPGYGDGGHGGPPGGYGGFGGGYGGPPPVRTQHFGSMGGFGGGSEAIGD